jgi:cytochrome P450
MALDPPGPSFLELLRNSSRLQRNPLPDWLEWQQRFGDVVQVKIPGQRFYFVFHPDHVEYVLKTNPQNFIRETPAMEILRLVQGRGLATVNGEEWRQQRKLLNPLFHGRRVESYADLMTEIIEDYLELWEGPAARGEVLDMVAHMVSLAIRVGTSVLVSHDFKDELPEMERNIRSAQAVLQARLQAMVKWPLWIPFPSHLRLRRSLAYMDRILHDLIETRRSSGADLDDVLGLLMKVRDPESGQGLSDLELRDQVMTIAGAAHDTTGLGLSWTWYLLVRHPEVYRRLQDEVDGVLGGRMPTAEDLPKMPWAYQVLEEMMRFCPPIYTLMRRVEEEDEIGGFRILPGAYILTPLHVTHRHPDFWEEPDRFDPSRFDPGKRAGCHPYAYFPFGAGPHTCIGKPFALLDTQLIVTAIASRFRLRLDPPDFIAGVRAGFSYRPDGAIPMRVERI